MKRYYMIGLFLIVSSLFAQNKKYDTIMFKNIILNNDHLFFELKKIPSLEKYIGQIEKKVNISAEKTKIPLTKNQISINEFSSKNIMLFTTKDSAFVHYFNFEKSKRNLTLKFNKKRITLSSNYKLFQFRKTFPNSYKLAKGINATPLSKAAFIPVFVVRSSYKGYLCFTFYDSMLIDVFLSNSEPETPY
jgi:hypothetical protein